MTSRRALDDAGPQSEAFYSGALDRISRFMVVLAVASERCRMVALWLARGPGIRLRLRRRLPEFPLAEAGGDRRWPIVPPSRPAAIQRREWCCASCFATF